MKLLPHKKTFYLRFHSDLVWWTELKSQTLNKAYHKFIKLHQKDFDKCLGRKQEQSEPLIKNLNVHFKNFEGKRYPKVINSLLIKTP